MTTKQIILRIFIYLVMWAGWFHVYRVWFNNGWPLWVDMLGSFCAVVWAFWFDEFGEWFFRGAATAEIHITIE